MNAFPDYEFESIGTKNLKKLTHGISSEIFEWVDHTKIIKLVNGDGDPGAILAEYLISQVAWDSGLSVPQPFELKYVDGRPGIVFERIHGATLMEYLQHQLPNPNDPNHTEKLSCKDLAQITAKALFDTHKKTAQNLPRQRESIVNAIRNAIYLPVSERRLALDVLNRIPVKQQLCHGDFNPNNVLIRGNEAVLIDWMYASQGNPEADLAEYILMLRCAEMPLTIPVRKAMIDELVAEYMKLSDTTYEAIDSWMIPVAARRLSCDILPGVEIKQLVNEFKKRAQRYHI